MTQTQPVKIGLLGLGTVGGGTISVLNRNATEIERRAGRAIQVVAASARDIEKPRDFSTDGIELMTRPEDVVDHPEVDVVVELIGGCDIAYQMVLRANEAGKHVVTANKALIAHHGNELFAKASEQGVMIAFEAAVAGGIPIIKTVREALAGNRVEWLAGIINGTSNFILTEMRENATPFAEVLAEAQRLGYAEADPTFDVDGTDAAHKLAILAAIAFGTPLNFEAVTKEGIDALEAIDVENARQLGYRIKHLGIARWREQGLELRVHPTLVPEQHILASVDGVMNAVLVRGDAVGPLLLSGAGAGAEPTASSVVADIVDVVRALTSDPENRVPHLAFQADSLNNVPVLPMQDTHCAFYLRLMARDRAGVLADVTDILRAISIEAIRQTETSGAEEFVPVVILTQRIDERLIDEAIARIEALESVSGRVVKLRVECFGG